MEFTTVEQAINWLQSAVIALVEAQGIIEDLEPDMTLSVEGLSEMLSAIDHDAWWLLDTIREI